MESVQIGQPIQIAVEKVAQSGQKNFNEFLPNELNEQRKKKNRKYKNMYIHARGIKLWRLL